MPQAPSTRQIMLGIFILGQGAFLISANLINFLRDIRSDAGPQARQAIEAVAPGWPEEKGHLWQLMEHIAKTDRMWAQATGQFQTWSLFAPTIGRECVFPAVEYRWDQDQLSALAVAQRFALLSVRHCLEAASLGAALEGASRMTHKPELVLSPNEPVHLDHYLRIGNFRLRRYENNLVITLRPDDDSEKTQKQWRDKIRTHVADYAEIIHGYLRWRLGQDRERWPGREVPRQLILVLRRFHINDYEEAPPLWTGPHAVPMARWLPAATWDASHQPLEWYDPLTKRFESLRK